MKACDTVKSGELLVTQAAQVCPTVPCNLVKFKAGSGNAGSIYIGTSTVTRPDNTEDQTTGFELAPGDETGWMPVSNLNVLYRIGDVEGDRITYLALL